MRKCALIAAGLAAAVLGGCNTTDPPLVFGSVRTFGAQISATAPDQGGNLTLGYRSANVSVVPVTTRGPDGDPVRIYSNADNKAAKDRSDAMSTFAHFEFQSGGTGVSPLSTCLGDTFATGIAAQNISNDLSKICKR